MAMVGIAIQEFLLVQSGFIKTFNGKSPRFGILVQGKLSLSLRLFLPFPATRSWKICCKMRNGMQRFLEALYVSQDFVLLITIAITSQIMENISTSMKYLDACIV